MRLNLEKLDDRLKKLQEIRRLAADPEMLELLTEFLSSENGAREKAFESAPPEPVRTAPQRLENAGSRDDVSEVVKEVLQRSDHGAGNSSIGLWNRKKA